MMFACELLGFSDRRGVTVIGITSQISIFESAVKTKMG